MLPDFLVIGPGKSGSTWMYHALKSHPEVCMSTAKETLFFEEEFDRGIEWYSGFFKHCSEGVKAIGEASNTYIYNRKAPERIRSINPEMKLITCLRNPVERAFSHYLFLIRGGQFQGTFREALDDHPKLINEGKYFKHLKPYFEHFDDECLYIDLFDNLKKDEDKFIRNIYNFLEVDPEFIPSIDQKYRLSAAKPRNKYLASLAKKGADFMRYLGNPELISKIKYSRIADVLYKEYKQDEKPTISLGDRIFLEKQFTGDIEKLGSKLNIDLLKLWFNNV